VTRSCRGSWQFTCFTGTKVQILTQQPLDFSSARRVRAASHGSLLALLVQKYKYCYDARARRVRDEFVPRLMAVYLLYWYKSTNAALCCARRVRDEFVPQLIAAHKARAECFTSTKVLALLALLALLVLLKYSDSSSARRVRGAADSGAQARTAQFTCFTGTKAQILTPVELLLARDELVARLIAAAQA
jgi:hypothetical protein